MSTITIDEALKVFANLLPEQSTWIILATRSGTWIGGVGDFRNTVPPPLDNQQAALLTYSHAMDEIRTLDGIKHGTFQYSVSIGSEGVYFIFHLNDAYLLGSSYQWIGVNSFDAILDAVLMHYHPLLDVLYSGAS